MQETSDGGRAGAGVLCNTSHNPLPVGVMDHDSPTQSDHHEGEGATKLITGRPPSISHPKNMADSRHSGTLVMEQGHLPNPLTSSGLTRAFKDDEPDSLTSIGLTRMSKDPELDTTTLSTRSDLVAPTLPTCGPGTQDSPDRASASLLRNTSHSPLSVGVRDHDSPAQSDHHEEQGATQPSSISHPKNVTESHHGGTLALEQEHLPDPLTSTGSPQMFKVPELDTATSGTSSYLVAPTFEPILDEHKLRLFKSQHHQAKSESHPLEEKVCLLKAELHVTQLAESSHRRSVVHLRNEVEEKDYEIAELRQKLRQKDEQIEQRDRTIQKLRKQKCEELPQLYAKVAQMEWSIQELKEQNTPEGEKRKGTETVSKDHVLRSYECNGKQVIKIKGATQDNR